MNPNPIFIGLAVIDRLKTLHPEIFPLKKDFWIAKLKYQKCEIVKTQAKLKTVLKQSLRVSAQTPQTISMSGRIGNVFPMLFPSAIQVYRSANIATPIDSVNYFIDCTSHNQNSYKCCDRPFAYNFGHRFPTQSLSLQLISQGRQFLNHPMCILTPCKCGSSAQALDVGRSDRSPTGLRSDALRQQWRQAVAELTSHVSVGSLDKHLLLYPLPLHYTKKFHIDLNFPVRFDIIDTRKEKTPEASFLNLSLKPLLPVLRKLTAVVILASYQLTTDTAIMAPSTLAVKPQAIAPSPTAHITKRSLGQPVLTNRVYVTATYSDTIAPMTRLLVEMWDTKQGQGVLVDLLINCPDSFARMLESVYGVLDRARYRYQESWVARDAAF